MKSMESHGLHVQGSYASLGDTGVVTLNSNIGQLRIPSLRVIDWVMNWEPHHCVASFNWRSCNQTELVCRLPHGCDLHQAVQDQLHCTVMHLCIEPCSPQVWLVTAARHLVAHSTASGMSMASKESRSTRQPPSAASVVLVCTGLPGSSTFPPLRQIDTSDTIHYNQQPWLPVACLRAATWTWCTMRSLITTANV
jgi:hypothetical protein